jgi:hypothetical protein
MCTPLSFESKFGARRIAEKEAAPVEVPGPPQAGEQSESNWAKLKQLWHPCQPKLAIFGQIVPPGGNPWRIPNILGQN